MDLPSGAESATESGGPGSGAGRGARRSIHVHGLAHTNPIPNGSRIGSLVWSSAITGRNPASGELPPESDEQVRRTFENLQSFLVAAGVTPEDVIRLGVTIEDASLRPEVNRAWAQMFPDDTSRPARHTMVDSLPGGAVISVEAVAVASSP